MSLLDESGLALLEKAREQKETYNWLEAVRLFDHSVDFYIDKKDPEKVMEICIEVVTFNQYYYYTLTTAEQNKEVSSLVFKIFEKSESFYKQLRKKPEELVCTATNLLANSLHQGDVVETEKNIDRALEICNTLNEIYNEEKEIMMMISLFTTVLLLLIKINICTNPQESRELSLKIFTLSEKLWEISWDIRNVEFLIFSLDVMLFGFLILVDRGRYK